MDTNPIISRAIEKAGSQAKLAERSGLSQQLISKLFRNAVAISVETAVKLSNATEGAVSISELYPDIAKAVANEIAQPASAA